MKRHLPVKRTAAAVFFLLFVAFLVHNAADNRTNSLESEKHSTALVESPEQAKQDTAGAAPPLLKDEVLLAVPFLSQAPLGVWDALHQDACEEASLIMVHRYLTGQALPSPKEADREIINLIKWQNEQGYGTSVTLGELARIAKDYYGLNGAKIIGEPSLEIIKEQLDLDRPVIVPVAGRLLPNPYFRGEGPVYHMLVIKGFDRNWFITNDPGTKRGEGFRYGFDDLMNAVHDWDSNNIRNGRRAVLVFE